MLPHRPSLARPIRFALAAAALAVAAGGASADGQPPWPSSEEGAGRCSLRLQAVPGAPRAADFRVKCEFMVEDLWLEASRRVRRFSDRLALKGPDPEDQRPACARESRSEVSCHGMAGEGVAISGRLRATRPVCARRRLGLKVWTQGGYDCDAPGEACPAAVLIDFASRKRPAGC
jgi:hypothetical protein